MSSPQNGAVMQRIIAVCEPKKSSNINKLYSKLIQFCWKYYRPPI